MGRARVVRMTTERVLHVILYHASWCHWWQDDEQPAQHFASREEAIRTAEETDFGGTVRCVVHDECGNALESWFAGRKKG